MFKLGTLQVYILVLRNARILKQIMALAITSIQVPSHQWYYFALFHEEKIFIMNASLPYGPRLQTNFSYV